MNRDDWTAAARELYRRMLTKAQVDAPAVVGVVELHRPKQAPNRGLPVCHGCDKAHVEAPDPEWPCRTFAVLAKELLNIESVEDQLEHRIKAR